MQDVDLPSHLCGFRKTRAEKPVRMCTIGTAPPQQRSLPIRLRGGTRGFLSSVRPAPVSCTICGDYSRCRTTWFNRLSVCFHSLAAQYTRVLSSNRKRCPAPFVIPAGCRVEEGGGESMLSNAEIGKCHFDKCKALCTHRLNFDGSLPRRGLLFLFIGLHTKMLNNDVTESKYKCHRRKTSPDEPAILFFSENVFSARSTGV